MSEETLTVCGVEVPWSAHTLEGFRGWLEGLEDRGLLAHFSRGSVHVEMGPQHYRTHGPLVIRVNRVLGNLADALDLGFYYEPPSWFTHAATGLSTEPDGFLARWETLETGLLQVNPERPVEMIGRPDLAFEAVSDTSERKDTVELLRDYAAAGVAEYWLADGRNEPASLRIFVRGADGAYAEQGTRQGWLDSPTFGRRFRLSRFTNRGGLTDFRLEVQPPHGTAQPPRGEDSES